MPIASLRYQKNLRGSSRDLDARPLYNRVFPKGPAEDGIHWRMANARWEIVARDTAAKWVMLGADAGGEPIRFVDQLNKLALQPEGTNTLFRILDSGTDQVCWLEHFDSDTLTLGAKCYVRVFDPCNPNGWRELTYLDHPASIATYGLWEGIVEREDIPPIDNIAPNPYLTFDDTGGFPPGWETFNATHISEATGPEFHRYGENSIRVEAYPGLGTLGIESNWIQVFPTAEKPYFSLQAAVLLEVGSIAIRLICDPIGNTAEIPVAHQAALLGLIQIPDPTVDEQIATSQLNVWVDLIADNAFNLWEVGARKVKISIECTDPDAAIFYLDAVQPLQQGTKGPFIFDGLASNELWHSANDHLELVADAVARYEMEIVDRYRIDPVTFRRDELILGSEIEVYDPDNAPNVTLRLADIRRKLMETEAGNTRVLVSNKPEDLSKIMGRETRPNRVRPVDVGLVAEFAGDIGGALSTPQLQLLINPDGDGKDYHLITWLHTPEVESPASNTYTVDIDQTIDDGTPTSLVTGRDPRLEYGGTNSEFLRGSYRTEVFPGTPGVDPIRNFVYTVTFKTGGTAGATYKVSHTGVYV